MGDFPEVRFASLPSPSIALTHCRLTTQSPQTHHKIVDAQNAQAMPSVTSSLIHGRMPAAPPPDDQAVDFAVHQRALAGGEDSLYELYDCERHGAFLALHRLEEI